MHLNASFLKEFSVIIAYFCNFSETGPYFLRENVLWFSLCCPTTALSVCSLLFSKAVPNNYPLLQLQLLSAGRFHVAFRNLCESQS